jgi:hypothetical protein
MSDVLSETANLSHLSPPITVDRSLCLEHHINKNVLEYWRSRCGRFRMPRRQDIDPIDLLGSLNHVWLSDVLTASGVQADYHIRVAGEGVEAVFGTLTGRMLSKALPAESLRRWQNILGAVVAERVPLRFSGGITFQQKYHLIAESVIMPLSENDDKVSMLLGSFVAWSRGSSVPGTGPKPAS